jgi:hypothetical protein
LWFAQEGRSTAATDELQGVARCSRPQLQRQRLDNSETEGGGMSVELVKLAMHQFLANDTPEVLCIKGKWGTGKTHAWDDAVKESKANDKMSIKRYAYVSLFGMNDPSDIMQSICVNTNHVNLPNDEYNERANKIANIIKRVASFASEHANTPYISGLGGIARAVITNAVFRTVVCIDDFERKSKNISVNDIMGTVAQLRDSRKCKVVLILNDDTLSAAEMEDFTKYSEKVINWSFRFDPSPAESAQIAFSGNDALNNELRNACCQLEIKNIRVLYKIKGFAERLVELLKDVDKDVMNRVLRSLVVIVWAIVSATGEGAASLEFIKRNRLSKYLSKKEQNYTAEENRLGSLLDRYGFTHFDEFDSLLANDVSNGFFNDDKIRAGADKYLKDAERAHAEAALEAAWGPYHYSFDDNKEEVARVMFNGIKENIRYISEMNLNTAITILKDIGYPNLGNELIAEFIKAQDDLYVFDGKTNPWGKTVEDPDLIREIETLSRKKMKPLPTPKEAAELLYKGNWTNENEEVLGKITIDELVSLFKSVNGKEQYRIVKGCLCYQNVLNRSERQNKITESAVAALVKIGSESALNADRMAKYGIDVKATLARAAGPGQS